MARKSRNKQQQKKSWYKIDLHLHTPASADYQEKNVTYLDILRQAEIRELDVIAFTDHNTVNGYATMLAEIEQLELLESMNRAEPDEQRQLEEYRRLLKKILVLPGFEFTATFGFHVLGIFPPNSPPRLLEHVLLSLNIPLTTLEEGSSIVGASSDVLTAYRIIREKGGLVIPAHVNSSHGVFMKHMDFGGQTRIAYTQDPNIHCLEVTDLEKRGRYTTQRFFDGTKPGYSRRMRCIQGSDAHRLTASGNQKNKDLGIGDRITEILLPERDFESIRRVFESKDFSLTRPYRSSRDPYDHIQSARDEGETIVQSFHDNITRKGGHLYAIISDVCAFANTNGGTIYVGVSANPKEAPLGISKVSSSIESIAAEIDKRITPEPDVEIDAQNTRGKAVIRVQVQNGDNIPYAVDENKFYIREEGETNLAVRDEIVRLIKTNAPIVQEKPETASEPEPQSSEPTTQAETTSEPKPENKAPLTGVEVIGTEKRRGTLYHTMRDLRNNNVINNVTRSSARRLWHYAIMEVEENKIDPSQVQWIGDYGLVKRYKKAGASRYDLIQRVHDENGKSQLRVYYGVTEDGMHGDWTKFVVDDGDEGE